MSARIAVLASGSGTNLQSLIDADLGPGEIALVLSNVPEAFALERARRAGVPVETVDHRRLKPRSVFDEAVVERLSAHAIDWVVFAGFMRVVTEVLIDAFENRIVNIHPAILPAFPGLDAQAQAFRAGVRIAGCTVHLVDKGVDTGPILAQAAVPVFEDDDEERLRSRILAEEHRILPKVVRALAEGRLRRRETGGFFLEGLGASGGPTRSGAE